LERSGIAVVEDDPRAALDSLRGTSRMHVHLDLDVLDPDRVAPANELAPPGGLLPGQVEEALRTIRERYSVASATISSYDPSFDGEGRVLDAAIGSVRALVERR
jgi:arginase family enzyme